MPDCKEVFTMVKTSEDRQLKTFHRKYAVRTGSREQVEQLWFCTTFLRSKCIVMVEKVTEK